MIEKMDRRKKITLEELLQLKRAERPSPEFWDNFDRELRSKQLAALVRTKPWWQSLVSTKNLVRVCVPLGAAAAVAISFGSFHGVASRSNGIEVAKQQAVPDAASRASTPVAVSVMAVSNPSLAMAETSARHEEVRPNLETPVAISNEKAQEAAGQVLATSAATMKAAGLALAQLAGLNDPTMSPMAVQPRVVEPLAQIASPRDNRRSRLLASSVAYDPHATSSTDSVRTRDHIARRISDEAVYDSISRLGMSGNSVSIKF